MKEEVKHMNKKEKTAWIDEENKNVRGASVESRRILQMELTTNNRYIEKLSVIYKIDTYRCKKRLYAAGILL